MNENHLNMGGELRQGEYLTSVDGKHRAVFQDNGNFAIISESSVTWQTKTSGSHGMRIVLQADGNLVMYTQYRKVVWSSYSYSLLRESAHVRLTLTNEGLLELDRDGVHIWSSATSENWRPKNL
ncbi:B-type lectin plumieribetin-like [Lampris incognitus]|uniref:B-type lectin plumieribetin-like n=1 Tax=Lampris incognitus TaxID=2546036 RepID=UPI0024B5D538|nr:B-type lectin plumieribetin-like [Lampris incognitus]